MTLFDSAPCGNTVLVHVYVRILYWQCHVVNQLLGSYWLEGSSVRGAYGMHIV